MTPTVRFGTVSWTQLQPGAFKADRDVVDLGSVRIARRAYSVACRGEGTVEPQSSLFGILGDTRTHARWRGDRVSVDDVAVSSDVVDVCTAGPGTFFTIGVDARAAELGGFDRPLLVRSRTGVGRLRHCLRYLCARDARASTAQQKAAAEDVLQLLTFALNVDAQTISTSQTQNRRLRAVRVCQDYMIDHLESTVTLVDLAKVSGLGVRSLFNAFEAVTGLSPMLYLRAKRLNGVRAVLLDKSLKDTRIIDVAADWGFWHLGHFAAAYCAMFGETPSQTLRRSWRN